MELNTTNPHCFTYKTRRTVNRAVRRSENRYIGPNAGNNKSNSSKQEACWLFKQC